jgi:acyl-[acyl-carrier-protein]-phospholipid O-acyltransferase/long-chain-fatty-acid--[acyl-carrier-protein] ligase
MEEEQGNLLHLLKTRRLLPLFVAQFLGALNDNLFKNALVILIIFRAADTANGQMAVTLAAGLFILPFFLFSATAGQMADKYEKSRLIRIIKGAEIGVMTLAVAAFFSGSTAALLAVLFLMGTQSAFFGPLKYAILPDHLEEHELIGGNGLIEAATFMAILIGTIAGGLLILTLKGMLLVSTALIVLALAGWIVSLYIPKAGPAAPELKINRNFLAETRDIIRQAAAQKTVFLAILGISWVWLIGATFLSQFPAFAKDVLGGDEQVITLFLTVFAVGIAVGSLICNNLLKGEVSAKFVPIGALGVTLFTIDLYFASTAGAPGAVLVGALAFLADFQHLRIVFDLFAIAIFAGLYIVPLYAIMQNAAEAKHRARTIAGNNILNALFMVCAALATLAMLGLGFTVPQVFLTLAILNFGVAVYICKLLPDALIKSLLAALFGLLYRVEVKGLLNFHKAGERSVIIANHVSFLDGLLLATYLPTKPTFAIATNIARKWWVRPFLGLVDVFPMDPTRPLATKSLIRQVQSGKPVVIFPEGRLTITGALMKIYEGPGMIADKADAEVLPVRIDGPQFTPFSRLKGKLRLRWFPQVTITILPPRRFEVEPEVKGRARRQAIGHALYDIMCDVIFETCDSERTLFEALCDARSIHGARCPVVEDTERSPLSYRRLIMGSMVLGRQFAKETEPGQYIGVMLPNTSATAVTFFALQAYGRIPAMLNFTAGVQAMQTSCKAASITDIVTSRRFVELAKLEDAVEQLEGNRIRVLYLEDLREYIGLLDKLIGALMTPVARWVHRRQCSEQSILSDSPSTVLFTSGSEGMPKAVVLSHRNLLSNVYQLSARVDFNPTDAAFNALPVFHSFGLMAGMLLPIVSGIRTFLYPSPLHYRIVPELVYDSNATIMFGTDTFLAGYARVAHAYDFYAVRYVFAGAEKVRDETRRVWSEKFGLRILEGYGATETSPVLATNTPMQYKAGTVGRFLPGIKCRLLTVPGIENGGRLLV